MHLHLSWFYPVLQGLVLGILGMALHELGHLLMAFAVGVKVKNVGFSLKGMYTVREAGPPLKNLIISLAGPVVNLALIFTWPRFHEFALANLCFTIFHLIPLKGSDGDRVLTCWDQMKNDRAAQVRAIRGAKRVTLVSARKHSALVT